MKTTHATDDSVPAAAQGLTKNEGGTGEGISALAGKDLDAPRRERFRTRNGVPLLPRRRGAKPVTLEMVNRLRDELA